MKKFLLLVLWIVPVLMPDKIWSQVNEFPYPEGFEQTFMNQNENFIPNWFGNQVDGTRIFQEDNFTKSGDHSLGLWPVVEEGEDEEEVEIFTQVHLDLSGMENVAARFWVATRATGAMKHVKLFMQVSTDGGLSFGSRVLMGSDHRGFNNVDSDFTEFVYALHPEAFDNSNVMLRFLTKAGARKGTAAKVLIDDVYIYAAEHDIFPPLALEPKPLSINQISIKFSEPVNSTALNVSNYSLNSIPVEGMAEISPEGDVVILNLTSPIAIGKYYELGIANIEDLAGNVVLPMTSEIIYNPLQEGLVITEIMYDEPPAEHNDNLEFIELYNVTDAPIELGGLRIKGGITSGRLPEYTLEPGAYWITAKNATVFTDFFGIPAYEWHGANLSNDEPETIYIINTDHHSDVQIDLVTYSVGSPWPEGAAGGGYSMVLCDATLDNNDPLNWSEATQFAGTYNENKIYASPGKGCCTSEILVDAGPDKIVYTGLPEKFSCTELSVMVSGGTPPYTYSWTSLPASGKPKVQVCPAVTTKYIVTVTDAEGCSGIDEITVLVSNISGKDKIELCYSGRTLRVPPAAVKNYLSKGAELGSCETVTSIAGLGEEMVEINIFPNPSTGPVNFSFKPLVPAEAAAKIVNFSGQNMRTLFSGKVLANREYNFDLNAGSWPAGIYFFIVKTEGHTYSRQFLLRK
ncbi:lamin tail domain-containing protein [Salinimicrobium sediminilitoris]|uniref:lamin tail domain-containing protein n=1 Tax=Salinimicrobium sediminilitoris TaxID=2876715 RepID=UPI001E5F7770|nr:lamin tail domain-containing protein [Salinimicrobium sediminilitoris]MCC8358717.1 lamin tail domain-containing protein [Salinimicrobium sediminilitoris]